METGFEYQDGRTSLGKDVSLSFTSHFQSLVNGSPGILTQSSVLVNRRQRKISCHYGALESLSRLSLVPEDTSQARPCADRGPGPQDHWLSCPNPATGSPTDLHRGALSFSRTHQPCGRTSHSLSSVCALGWSAPSLLPQSHAVLCK